VILTFYEYAAESWLQAATSHTSKIHCLLLSEAPGLTLQWNSRPNMETKYWVDIPTLPYKDSCMDLISSRLIPLLLRSSQWPVFVQECVRVLRPGGVLEVTILDPMPRNCGPLLRLWTAKNLVLGLETRFLVTHPAMIIPLQLDDVSGFGRLDSMTFAYSATADEETHELRLTSKEMVDPHPQSDEANRRSRRDLQRLRTAVGRYFYQALYNDLVPEVSQRLTRDSELEPQESIRRWWWKDPAIVEECKKQGTVFEMVTYKCRKEEPVQRLARS
jgi:SAM-dependent methyltransferase